MQNRTSSAPYIALTYEHGGKPHAATDKTASPCFPRHFPAFCTGLFSATQTEAVVQLARAGLRNAIRIKVAVVPSAEQQQQQQSARVASGQTAGPSGAQRTPSSLEIQYHICDSVQKLQQLVKFVQVHLTIHFEAQLCVCPGRDVSLVLSLLCSVHNVCLKRSALVTVQPACALLMMSWKA